MAIDELGKPVPIRQRFTAGRRIKLASLGEFSSTTGGDLATDFAYGSPG